ncbi:PREDICTED: testicular haploid expressed gene protein-like [Bactrocera latifrons]|uniref:testicular haploid expressed gene protein-like n=1 Tax=Bactrocera latifrons TaxID=174628 RepID=UPI0008DE5862|nr:PREDICTED: testicular haploid expressed gene protein-like [Bactrocera latifrons]
MHKVSRSSKCCPTFDHLPENISCFLPDIYKSWHRLVERHKHMFTKRKRLLKIAQHNRPIKGRFIPQCPCKYKKPIEFVRDVRIRTRTEQLALPAVRRLLLFKETVKDLFEPLRIMGINRLIRLSLLSVYSRLTNIQPPQKKVPIHKWDEAEWKKHTKYLKKLAKPKKEPKQPKLPVQRMKLDKMTRFKALALPKTHEELAKEPWVLTPAMKTYEPSENIKKMALPTAHDDSAMIQSLPVPINPTALTYKATKRTKELATAREKGVGESDLKENPFSISPNALKARPTARIKELAEPKEYENTHIRENPFAISPAALKAKASPRIIELAKPKGS